MAPLDVEDEVFPAKSVARKLVETNDVKNARSPSNPNSAGDLE